jgi:cephalosporin hydroxylase
MAELLEIEQYSRTESDISDHLVTLFVETLCVQPSLIVELGVRGGSSTFVFERVANLCKAQLIGVDIADCSKASSWPPWHFVREDDRAFAAGFVPYCRHHQIDPSIDVLFIDTSHLYQHTVDEIACWFPFLADRARVFFHDSNERTVGRRSDGRLMRGTRVERGVMRAIERYFGTAIQENIDFSSVRHGWILRHWSNCNGLTMLERLPNLNTHG